MKREELLIWAAGCVDMVGEFEVTRESGLHNKPYIAITLYLKVEDEQAHERLLAVNDNGWQVPGLWSISGYAALRGFLRQVWKYLTPSTRARANEALRQFKEQRNALG